MASSLKAAPSLGPQRVADRAVGVERIAEADDEGVLGAPAGVGRPAVDGGAQLLGVEAGALGEEGGMHTPFVLRAAARGDAMDDDLALAQGQVALVEQAGAHEALEQARIARQHPEQDERRDAGRHQGIEAGLHLGCVGRIGGSDARSSGHERPPVL